MEQYKVPSVSDEDSEAAINRFFFKEHLEEADREKHPPSRPTPKASTTATSMEHKQGQHHDDLGGTPLMSDGPELPSSHTEAEL